MKLALYDRDFHAWALETAAALREGRLSLRAMLPDLLAREYPGARERVLLETALLALPEACPFALNEILGKEFWPG